MDHVDKAKALMQDHVRDPVSIQWIADAIGMSPFYFSRLFTMTEGIGPAAFYRRLRMEDAATRVRDGVPLVEIALEYGFESQQTFTRAFTAVFGMASGKFRRANSKEQTEMNQRIEPVLDAPTLVSWPERRFAGRSVRVDGLGGKKPSDAWSALDGRAPIVGERTGQTYGLCFGEAEDGSHIYMAAVEVDDAVVIPGWDMVVLPAQYYMQVRQHLPIEGHVEHLRAGLEKIWTNLLPASGRIAEQGVDIETYPDELTFGRTEGWLTYLVPLAKKDGR